MAFAESSTISVSTTNSFVSSCSAALAPTLADFSAAKESRMRDRPCLSCAPWAELASPGPSSPATPRATASTMLSSPASSTTSTSCSAPPSASVAEGGGEEGSSSSGAEGMIWQKTDPSSPQLRSRCSLWLSVTPEAPPPAML